MIEYHYETNFELKDEDCHNHWIENLVKSYGFELDELNYIFCDDTYLLEINRQYLNHDYLTDIITFPYDTEAGLKADIFISIERVAENGLQYKAAFEEELRRVMIHGVLHLIGFSDSSDEEKAIMREKENEALQLFHVKP